jgi:protein-S-isoprenylcysteine O-methyltransferase Ste14
MIGRMLAFVAAVTLTGAAIGYLIGWWTFDSGLSGAVGTGLVGLLLGMALWGTRRHGAEEANVPAQDARPVAGAGRRRRPGRAAGKER